MGLYTKIIVTFFFSMAWGMSLFTPLANTLDTGVGFLKLALKISLSSLVLVMGINLAYGIGLTDPISLGLILLLLLQGLTFSLHQDKKTKIMWALYLLTQFLTWYLFNKLTLTFTSDYYTLIEYGHLLSSTLFLGIITFAMILGHWYLVTPKLSEKPLLHASYLLWIILIFKVFISSNTYLNHANFFEAQTELGEGYTFNWLLLSMRVLWGYVVIGIMSYYSYRLIKMRSIQSATGILYVMTFFVFIGELISSFLFFKHGLPL